MDRAGLSYFNTSINGPKKIRESVLKVIGERNEFKKVYIF